MRAVYEEDEIGGLSAELKSDIGTFKGKHGGRAPSAGEVLAGAARHGATPVASADADGQLFHRWDHDHAFGAVKDGLGDIVRNVEDLFQDIAGFLQTPAFFFL